MAKGPLSGIKVLEYCSFVSGPFCSKQFSDLGAEVIKVEPISGDCARKRGPFWKDIPNEEYSSLYLFCNTNKKGITLNLEMAEGREIFKKLAAQADILIEDTTPGEMKRLGLDYDVLKEINPGLIMASITPFGQTGPYSQYKAYYLNTFHAGSAGYLLPAASLNADREPIKAGGYLGEYDAGVSSAIAVMAAYFWKAFNGGCGQYLDLSKQEELMALERQNIMNFFEWGKSPTRCDCNYHTIRETMVHCKDDNYVKIVTHPDRQWNGLVRALGTPEWSKEERFATGESRVEHWAELTAILQEEGQRYTAEELFALVQSEGTASAPICPAEWVYSSPQSEARHFFNEIDHPAVGKQSYPGLPYRIIVKDLTEDMPTDNFAAPLLGQHNEEVYGALGYSVDEIVKLRQANII